MRQPRLAHEGGSGRKKALHFWQDLHGRAFGGRNIKGVKSICLPLLALAAAVVTAAQGVGDRFEPNDSEAAAYDFGETDSISEANLSVHSDPDVDYFTLTVPHSAEYLVTISYDEERWFDMQMGARVGPDWHFATPTLGGSQGV